MRFALYDPVTGTISEVIRCPAVAIDRQMATRPKLRAIAVAEEAENLVYGHVVDVLATPPRLIPRP